MVWFIMGILAVVFFGEFILAIITSIFIAIITAVVFIYSYLFGSRTQKQVEPDFDFANAPVKVFNVWQFHQAVLQKCAEACNQNQAVSFTAPKESHQWFFYVKDNQLGFTVDEVCLITVPEHLQLNLHLPTHSVQVQAGSVKGEYGVSLFTISPLARPNTLIGTHTPAIAHTHSNTPEAWHKIICNACESGKGSLELSVNALSWFDYIKRTAVYSLTRPVGNAFTEYEAKFYLEEQVFRVSAMLHRDVDTNGYVTIPFEIEEVDDTLISPDPNAPTDSDIDDDINADVDDDVFDMQDFHQYMLSQCRKGSAIFTAPIDSINWFDYASDNGLYIQTHYTGQTPVIAIATLQLNQDSVYQIQLSKFNDTLLGFMISQKPVDSDGINNYAHIQEIAQKVAQAKAMANQAEDTDDASYESDEYYDDDAEYDDWHIDVASHIYGEATAEELEVIHQKICNACRYNLKLISLPSKHFNWFEYIENFGCVVDVAHDDDGISFEAFIRLTDETMDTIYQINAKKPNKPSADPDALINLWIKSIPIKR